MSGIIRFISDPHFGHHNMAVKRGFPDSYCHDENIVAQWNLVVGKEDTTWILGDITMEKNDYSILDRLNGYKRVILGNHDMGNHTKHVLNHVNSIHGMTKIRDKTFGNIWLTHSPVHPMELEFRVGYNIHGHIHDKYVIQDKRYINVCMEVQDFVPKTLKQLIDGNK